MVVVHVHQRCGAPRPGSSGQGAQNCSRAADGDTVPSAPWQRKQMSSALSVVSLNLVHTV